MSLPNPPDGVDPEQLGSMGAAFMSARLLSSATELHVFEHLADGPRTLEELMAATGLPRRTLRVVANALVAMQVLELEGERYKNGPAAQAFLTGRTSVDLRAGMRMYEHLLYPMWLGFTDAVRTGEPARFSQPSAQFARIFSEGVEAWTWPAARALPDAYDFSRHTSILDVGGGTGSYLVPLLAKYPNLRATLFELPPSAAVARQSLADKPVRDRIDIVEGDAFFDPLPEGHDVVLVAGFIHLFDADKIVRVLGRIRARVARGATMLIVDQWMDATHAKPLLGALLAANYMLFAGDGDTYSLDEARPWLEEAGWAVRDRRVLAGVTSVVVAEAE